jgi:hypothetical protein
MNIRDDDQVSAVALIVESEADTAAKVVNGVNGVVAEDGSDGAATDGSPED